MTFSITIGAGNRSTNGQRLTLTSVEELAQVLTRDPTDVEGWWSGHLWQSDSRARPVQWQSSQVVMADVDYHDVVGKHAQRPGALDLAQVPCSLAYLTPRGARFVFVLHAPVTDPELMHRLARSAGALVNAALAEAGALADRDERGRPVNGYLADAQAQDLARFMYRACTVVKGEQRTETPLVGTVPTWRSEDLLSFEDAASAYEAPKSDVGKLLAAMAAEGEQDGSLALIKVAARAIRLGITSFESFLLASKEWNAKRARPWSEDELRDRFEAALVRFREQGMVLVPVDEKGRPAYSVDVLDRILREDREYEDRLSFDVVKGAPVLGGAEIRDVDFTEIRKDIVERYGFKALPKADVVDTVLAVCERRSFDRIQDYLEGLTWDGQERLSRVAGEVLGVEECAELAEVMVRRWFVGAVARGLEPGAKVDTALILQGLQGIGKSTFFRALMPDPDLYTDSLPHDLSHKDAREMMSRFWVVEYGEWEGLYKRTDIAALRTFMSTLSDSFRPPYGRVNQTFKRRAVLVGTVNPIEGILRDPEGSRRQWVVECKAVNLDLVEAWRDQLWAEAVALYRAGVQWWLTSEEDQIRAEIAEERYTDEDPEEQAIASAIDKLMADTKIIDRGWITLKDLLPVLGYLTLLEVPMGVARKFGKIAREKNLRKTIKRIEGVNAKIWYLPGVTGSLMGGVIVGVFDSAPPATRNP